MPLNPTKDTYILKDPLTGAMEEVSAEQADQIAAERGLQYATAEDIEQHNRAEKFGTPGQVAQGVVEKVGRGLSLGLGAEGFDEDARERAQSLERDFPTTSALAGVAPDVALGALTAGAGGLLTSAGRSAAARAAGGGVLRQGLAAGAGAATRGTTGEAAALLAAEAGLTGYTAEAEAAFIEDRELSVQSALANGALNFIVGGIPLAGVRAFTKRGAPKLGKNLLAEAESTAGEVAARRGLGREPSSGLPKSAGSAAEDFADDTWDKAIKSIDDQKLDKESIFLAENEPHILQLTTTQAADNLDEVKRLMDDGITEAVRAADFRKGADEWTDAMRARQAKFVRAEVNQGALDDIEVIKRAAADGTGEGWDAKGLGSESVTLLRNHRASILGAEGAEVNVALNHGKQALDKMIKRVGANRTLDDGTKAKLMGVLRHRADGWRSALQDREMFGRNADLQTDLNAAWSKTAQPLQRIQNRLMEILGQKYGEVGVQSIDKRAKAEAVGAALRRPVEYQREFADDLAEAINGVEELSRARSEHGLTQLEGMAPLRGVLQDLRDDFNLAATLQVAKRRAGEATKSNPSLRDAALAESAGLLTTGLPAVGSAAYRTAKSVWKGLKNAPSAPKAGTPLHSVLDARMKAYARNPRLADPSFSRALPEWMRGTLRGHGGQVAGVAALVGAGALLAPGEAGAAELDPEGTVRTREALNNVARSTRARVEASVAELFAGAKGKPSKAAPTARDATYRALVKKSEKTGHSLATLRMMGKKHADPEAAYEAARGALSRMVADPSLLADRMAQSWGDLPEREPEVFQALVMQATRVVGYLASKLPATTGKSLLDKNGFPPTAEELEEFAGHWQGALDPLSVADDLASGNAAEEAAEAVKANWAPIFTQFQAAAMGQLHELSESDEPIEQAELEYLDRVLDLDGAGAPMLSWDMAILIEQSEQLESKNPATQGAPGEAQRFDTPIETEAPERSAPKALQILRNPA